MARLASVSIAISSRTSGWTGGRLLGPLADQLPATSPAVPAITARNRSALSRKWW
jgi:hypothetical protein